jgi:hypothetical protein
VRRAPWKSSRVGRQFAVTDQGTGQLQQPEVKIGSAFVAGAQPFEGVQPGEAAFDHPAGATQAGSVRGAAAGDAWGDAAGAQQPPVLVVVVTAVGVDLAWLAPWSSTAAPDGWNRIQ